MEGVGGSNPSPRTRLLQASCLLPKMSEIIPPSKTSEDYLYQLRHSAAHVLAEAVKQLWPDTKLTIGPPTEDGFYYDFDSPHRFSPEDLVEIEKKMRFNLRTNQKFVGEEVSIDKARAYF